MSRRQSVQRLQRENQQRAAEQEAAEAKRVAMAQLGAFIMDADAHLLESIEQFGVTALRAQWLENARAAAAGAHVRIRSLMATTLRLAERAPPHAARFVLYTEERRGATSGRTPLGDRGMSIEYTTRSASVRRRQAERELKRLGIEPEYLNPNDEPEPGAEPDPAGRPSQ